MIGPLFHVSCREVGSRAVATLRGELDLAGHASMGAAVQELINSGKETVVLDVSELTFADVHSLRIWRDAAVRLHAEGRRLVLRDPTPLVRRVARLTAMDAVISIESSS